MMCFGLVAIIALILLTISFFVLIAVRKTDSRKLKIFGYVIAVLLWISTISLFIGHFYGMKIHDSQMGDKNSYHQPMMPQK